MLVNLSSCSPVFSFESSKNDRLHFYFFEMGLSTCYLDWFSLNYGVSSEISPDTTL